MAVQWTGEQRWRLSKAFPRSYLRRSLGVSLSDAQVEDRRRGLEMWLRRLLLVEAKQAVEAAAGGGGEGGRSVGSVASPATPTDGLEAVQGRVRRLLWESLGLHARVIHL